MKTPPHYSITHIGFPRYSITYIEFLFNRSCATEQTLSAEKEVKVVQDDACMTAVSRVRYRSLLGVSDAVKS